MAEEVNELKRKRAADEAADAECQEQKRIREEQDRLCKEQEQLRKKQERLRKKQERLRKEQERLSKKQGLLQDEKEQERKDQLWQQRLQELADFVETSISAPLEPEITERVLSCRKLGEIIEKTIKTKHETLKLLKSDIRLRMPDGNPVVLVINTIQQEIAKLNDTLLAVSFYPFE